MGPAIAGTAYQMLQPPLGSALAANYRLVADREAERKINQALAIYSGQLGIEMGLSKQQRETIKQEVQALPGFDKWDTDRQLQAIMGAVHKFNLPVTARTRLGQPVEIKLKGVEKPIFASFDPDSGRYVYEGEQIPMSMIEDINLDAGIGGGLAGMQLEAALERFRRDKGREPTAAEREKLIEAARMTPLHSSTIEQRNLRGQIDRATLEALQKMAVHPTQIGPAERLRSDYMKESMDFEKRKGSFTTLLALSKDHTPGSDLGMVFAWMKMLDPPSVVREGEQELARRAASMSSRVRTIIDRWWEGKILTPEQRQDFLKQARTIYREFERYQNRTQVYYRKQAEMIGVPVDFVVRSRTEGVVEPESESDPELDAIMKELDALEGK
jgi:hypothetical protein